MSHQIHTNAPHLTRFGISVLILAALLAACGASTPAPTPTLAIAPTPAPSDTPAVASTPTPLDPCQLIDSQAASGLAGTTYGPGEESTTPEGLKICTYGAQTTNIFTVDVARAASVDEAKADKTDFLNMLQENLAQLTSQGIQVTELPDFADGATMGQVSVSTSAGTFNGSAFAFLKGTVFVGFSDIVENGPAPTPEALQAEATTVMGLLP
jgi:hypothetical protein